MGLQKHFEDFNAIIKTDYDTKAELVEKRDILIKKLRDSGKLPSFEQFNQGSYAMHTGAIPIDKDYDIDVGLRFSVNKNDYNPMDLKEIIHGILEMHTEMGAEIQKPCVTTKYKKDGELAYHVDMPVYVYEDESDKNSQLYLGWGTNKSNQYWEEADPIGLQDLVNSKFEDADERAQFRRIIRFLKRWKNEKFVSIGNEEPPGIGITLLAYDCFVPNKIDYLESKLIPNDLQALINTVSNIKNMFTLEYDIDAEKSFYSIKKDLPVKPYMDVFRKMTLKHKDSFKKKLDDLGNSLLIVSRESDEIEQCKKLQKIFGDDFHVPEKTEVSEKQRFCMPSSNESGRCR